MSNHLPTPKHDPGGSAVGEDDCVCNAYAGTVGIISIRRPNRLAECEWNVTCNRGKGEGDVGEVARILGGMLHVIGEREKVK